jgi:predicted acyltransferase
MPLFLFLVGVSMAYSFRKRLGNVSSDKPLWKHTIKRIIILWILGMMVQGNLLTYDIEKIEFFSNTLQAIAAGYLISTILILYLPVSLQIFSTAALLLTYWLLAALIPVGGTTANAWLMQGNLPMYVDDVVLGQFRGWWHYAWIVPSLNFGATTMLGVFAGYMMQSDSGQMKKLRSFIILGVSLIILGLLMGIWQPVIKKIWTSSFVLFSGGICYLMLAVFYLLIDVWGLRKGFKWMVIIGSNAIFAYVAWHLFEKSLRGIAEVFLKGLNPYIGNWTEVLCIFGGTLVLYLILRLMYRYKIFIKI